LIASQDGREGSVTVDQDVSVYAGLFDGGERAVFDVRPARRVYVHVARGTVTVNGIPLDAGDALKATDTDRILIEDGRSAEVLLFDLA
jgi:Pirin-related protein